MNETLLTPEEEATFRAWVAQNKVNFNPDSAKEDYDMRGFWKAQQEGDANATTAINPTDHKLHYPDTYKKPEHPTFSVESKYATGDAAASAGHWEGETFIPPGITVDNSPTQVRGDIQAAVSPDDIMKNKEEPIDLTQLHSDKLYQPEMPASTYTPAAAPNVAVTGFDPDTFKKKMEADASVNKATDDRSLDYSMIDTEPLSPLDLTDPMRLAKKTADLYRYFTDKTAQVDVDIRKNFKPIRLMDDYELQSIMDNPKDPNYDNAWNERNLRDRWSKMTDDEKAYDVDYMKRSHDREAAQLKSSIYRIPGQAATLTGMAMIFPEKGLRALGAEGESPAKGAIELGQEWQEMVDKLYRTSAPETSWETAAAIAGGIIPIGGEIGAGTSLLELATPLTIGGPKRAVANFGVQFLGSEALHPAFAPEGDKYETIFQSFFRTDPAVAAEKGQPNSPLERDWVIAKLPDGTDIKNGDLDYLGYFGLGSIAIGFAPRILKPLIEKHLPVGKIVDPLGYEAPPELKTFETPGTLLRTYLFDPISSGLFSLARKVGVNNDNLYHAIETNTQAAQHEKIKNAIATGITRTHAGDYESAVPAGRILQLAEHMAPEQRAMAEQYLKLHDVLTQMKAEGLSRVAGMTERAINTNLRRIEAAMPEVKQLKEMYDTVWRANKKFGKDFAPDHAVEDLSLPHKTDMFKRLSEATHATIKTTMDNTTKMRLIQAFRETAAGASMFVKVAGRRIKQGLKDKATWRERVVSFVNEAGEKEEYITTKYMKDILELDPHYARNAFLFGTGKLFQYGTTSYGAPWFALKQFFREAELGNQFAPQGFQRLSHIGPTIEINGHQVGISVPGMNYIRSLGGLFEMSARKIQRSLTESIYRALVSNRGGPALVREIFGEDNLRAFADLNARSFLNSTYHMWSSSGGMGNSLTRSAIREGHVRIDAAIADLKLTGSKVPGLDTMALDKLYRMYKSLLDSMHSTGQYSFFAKNYRSLTKAGKMNDAKLDELIAATRKLTGELSISGRVYKGFTNKQIGIELGEGASKGLGAGLDLKAVEKLGPWIAGAQESSPWFNALLQGLRRTGVAYWTNPWRFQARLHTGLTLPMIIGYFSAYEFGKEYTDYMMNGREERQKATELYLPIAGKPPEEGIHVPMPLELAPLIYMELNTLDTFYRAGGGKDAATVAHTILENFGDLTTPPFIQSGVGLIGGMKAPGTMFFGGEGYMPRENPKSPFNANIELAVRGLMGSVTDIYIAGIMATLEHGDVDAGLAEMEYRAKQRTPMVAKVQLGPFTELNESYFAFADKLDEMEQIYREHLDPETIGLIKKKQGKDVYAYGEDLSLLPNMVPKIGVHGNELKQMVPDESGGKAKILEGVPLERAGLPSTPPPTNPVYIEFAKKINDLSTQRSGNFAYLTTRLKDLTKQVRSLQQVNSGNLRDWKKQIDDMPDADELGRVNKTKKEMQKLDLNDRDSVRKAINYYNKERIKTLQTIELLTKEVEDQITSDLIAAGRPPKTPIKLMEIDPYSSENGDSGSASPPEGSTPQQ